MLSEGSPCLSPQHVSWMTLFALIISSGLLPRVRQSTRRCSNATREAVRTWRIRAEPRTGWAGPVAVHARARSEAGDSDTSFAPLPCSLFFPSSNPRNAITKSVMRRPSSILDITATRDLCGLWRVVLGPETRVPVNRCSLQRGGLQPLVESNRAHQPPWANDGQKNIPAGGVSKLAEISTAGFNNTLITPSTIRSSSGGGVAARFRVVFFFPLYSTAELEPEPRTSSRREA